MSGWLRDGEVLEGEGSGQAPSCSPRWLRGFSSPMPGRGRGPGASPSARDMPAGTTLLESMGKAKELFELCDKEGKGFITKRDVQRLQGELPLSPDQLESVFESLDRDRNGFLTPVEFHTGLGELVGVEESIEKHEGEERVSKVDPGEIKFTQILVELGADKLFKDQWELCALWCELQKERPELLSILEEVLTHAVSHVQDSLRERDSLEQALRRREYDHDKVIRSIYEDMETQSREDREKQLAQDSIRQLDRREQLQEELRMREQELEFTLTKQREMESRIEMLSSEQADTRGQNHRLQSMNLQLQEQLEYSREELEAALSQLQLIQTSINQQQSDQERDVLKVSKNMQKEKESLMRQLDLLRDMNKRLRDEKDAHQSQKRTPNMKKPLEKKGSIIGDYLLHDQTVSRQLSHTSQLRKDSGERPDSAMKTLPANENGAMARLPTNESGDIATSQTESRKSQPSLTCPQRIFKLVFLGNSGVGKSSFIYYYCRGHFPNNMSATVGIDFQVRSVVLGSTPIALQLWDTAGQERFQSITQQYYRKADAILAMYDITQLASFASIRGWLDQVQERMAVGAVLMLLGNKSDMAVGEERQVTAAEGQRLAEQYQAEFYECSAKSGSYIEEAMTQLAG